MLTSEAIARFIQRLDDAYRFPTIEHNKNSKY